MTFFAVILLCTISVVAGATTKAHHGHHHHHSVDPTAPTTEPVEREGFGFKYDPVSHVFAIRTHHMCYIYTLTQQELVDVHTSHGLKTLEIKMIQAIDDGTGLTTMSVDDLNALNPALSQHFCKSHNTYQKLTVL